MARHVDHSEWDEVLEADGVEVEDFTFSNRLDDESFPSMVRIDDPIDMDEGDFEDILDQTLESLRYERESKVASRNFYDKVDFLSGWARDLTETGINDLSEGKILEGSRNTAFGAGLALVSPLGVGALFLDDLIQRAGDIYDNHGADTMVRLEDPSSLYVPKGDQIVLYGNDPEGGYVKIGDPHQNIGVDNALVDQLYTEITDNAE